MASKKHHDSDEQHENTVTNLLKNVDVGPWLDRASEMLQARPAVTLGAAMGVGFVLGLTLFSKIGRIALIGAIGLGTEIAMQRLRTSAAA
jgi:hypothetical protein